MGLSFSEIKNLFNHASCVISIPFFHFVYSLYLFLGAHSYTLYFIILTKCLNNEHEDNQEIQPEFDFERMSYNDENDSEGDMDYETLPLEMRRLIDQKNKQILPHQEAIEVINLGSNEERKKSKDRQNIVTEIKKEINNLLHEYADVFASQTKMQVDQ